MPRIKVTQSVYTRIKMRKILIYLVMLFILYSCESRSEERRKCVEHFMAQGETREDAEDGFDAAQADHASKLLHCTLNLTNHIYQ